MPLFADVAELRTYLETDLPDGVLTSYWDDAERSIVQRYGWSIEDSPTRVTVLRGGTTLLLAVPEQIVEIKEGSTVLVPGTDYEAVIPTRLTRLPAGSKWADYVTVEYTPFDDTDLRRRVVVQLVKLAIEYNALESEKVGDYTADMLDYSDERARILESLSPVIPRVA